MPPGSDAEVAAWVRDLGLPGLVDLHVHFLPERVLAKVWAYFDHASANYGVNWPIHYRTSEPERVESLRALGVRAFAPLVYPHKPGMAAWLNDWVRQFAAEVPEAVTTATFFPEPEAKTYVRQAIEAGARCFKSHVQVGDFDPREELLRPVWGQLADAGLPVVVHCGHGPLPGTHTGLDVFEAVLREHPSLVAVIAHAGMPEYDHALRLVESWPGVHLDTTMVGVEFTSALSPLPKDWTARLAALPGRIALGTDFPNIPYSYAEQLRAIVGWAESDDRLGADFLRAVLHDTPARLLGLS
ncbi:amidohydrolase family protein [Allokutzneria multivorans]|uniref:Amidohydrolase family protein n=1 Tax=Allokutzneria multivorans TaxID=1142134 RepID=A0ABP7TTF5_9PSEU